VATTVEPAEFHMVDFDAGRIAQLTDELAEAVGLGADVDIHIEVDETVLLGHTELVSADPVHIRTESGAFEDTKKLRGFSEEAATDVLGRHLLRARDRRSADFGDPPSDEGLPLAHRVAWEVHTVGRLTRAGYPAQRQRWLYQFRNRHGFTDAADEAFEALWDADDLTWDRIAEISDRTAAQNPGKLDRKPA
jgi:hypothetical protein